MVVNCKYLIITCISVDATLGAGFCDLPRQEHSWLCDASFYRKVYQVGALLFGALLIGALVGCPVWCQTQMVANCTHLH